MTTDPIRAGITEKQPLLRLAQKWFDKKYVSSQKNTQNFFQRLIFILEKAQKSNFCYKAPILVNVAFVALRETVYFQR